jgi:hypothetical protein
LQELKASKKWKQILESVRQAKQSVTAALGPCPDRRHWIWKSIKADIVVER